MPHGTRRRTRNRCLMAIETSAWTMRHSPYTGTDLLIHLCLADVADASRADRLEVSFERIAAMTRTSVERVANAVDRFETDGLLTRVAPGSPTRPAVWRLICDPAAAVVFDRADAFGEEVARVR